MIAALAADVVLHGPVVGTPFEGRAVVGEVMRCLVAALEDLSYTWSTEGGGAHVVGFRMRVAGRDVEGADVIRLDAGGRIAEIVAMTRPFSGSAAVAAAVGPRLARRRGRVVAAAVALLMRPLPAVTALLFDRMEPWLRR